MAEAVRNMRPAPESLVAGGKFNFGTFSTQFKHVNPLDAERPLGIWMPKSLIKCRLKEWQAFQLGNRRWFLLVVLYNARFSALAQFIAYDRVRAGGFVDGRLVGFNLTDNQSLNIEKYNENCLWYDGKLQLLPPVKFARPQGVEAEWQIRDRYGRVDLAFKPVSMGRIDMNLVIIRVIYFGPFGSFRGFILNEDDQKISFDGFFGMGEQKYIRG